MGTHNMTGFICGSCQDQTGTATLYGGDRMIRTICGGFVPKIAKFTSQQH